MIEFTQLDQQTPVNKNNKGTRYFECPYILYIENKSYLRN